MEHLPINGTDYIELYVGNALQSAYYYQRAFGFQPFAYRGLRTGNKDVESYVVRQNKITIILTSALHSGTEVGQHVDKHGDAVKAIALWVDDARASFKETTARGADPSFEPMELTDDHGTVVISGIKLYGDTVHHFVERKNYSGTFLPGFIPWENNVKSPDAGLQFIDHMVANVGWGEMNKWVNFYRDVMGFYQLVSFDDKDISTEYTALMSKVMSNGNGRIKFPINEPAAGRKRSQIEEYLDYYESPGVQHIAMATNDIVKTVSYLKENGVEFLSVPSSYYDDLKDRVGHIDEEMDTLAELGILVDRDDEGYLLQLFTKPVEPRPTLFFEIIQRKGAKSFGKGNFKALFEAIEREQEIRGTL